jgi:sugar/nucleoside kinase (ribokinase family)
MAVIITMGVHILDILGRHVTEIPPGQNIALLDEIRLTVAGTAAGTAVDLAKLGASVMSMGAVGHDDAGSFVLDTMGRYGISTDHMVRKQGVQTSCTMLPIRPNGERPALHVIGTNAVYGLEDIHWDAIAQAQYLHFGGTYLLPRLDGAPTAEVLKYAKERGVITSLDMLAVARPDMMSVLDPVLPYIDYFMPGLDEVRMITGLDKREDIIRFFLDRGVRHTVFKMGAQGSSIAAHDMDEIRVPAYKVRVVDTTGCGDAYCAGFLVGLTHGWSLEKAGRFASAAASLVATGLGSDAGIIDFDHTLRFMETGETLPLE